ncbi:SpoIIE family protein phosphatase [Streptomyces sp. NPDC046831]|uniref:SpoIIE family protein phosphatase n=1 Tax=Streptomyces sp. NPDC046831 TaxID=3154805 RepID=UPI0033C50E0C
MDMHGAAPFGPGSGVPADPPPPGTAVVDAQGNVAAWSTEAEHLLGYAWHEVAGRPVLRLLGLEAGVADARTAGLPALLAEGGTTATLLHRDGRPVHVRMRTWPSRDADGRARYILMFEPFEPEERQPGRPDEPRPQEPRPEVTRPEEPRQDEPQPGRPDEPRPEEPPPEAGPSTTDEAFAQSHLPMAVWDSDLRIVRISAGAARELGSDESRLRGLRATDILPPHIGPVVEDGLRRALETGRPTQLQVRGSVRRGGPERVWSVTVSPLRTPAGLVRNMQVTALDITEQQLARERLALLNDVGKQVGSTLDVLRTAQKMADLVVGRLADFVTVDLLDALFRGVEPQPSTTGAVALRRAAQQSVLPGVPEALVRPGDVDEYPRSTPPVRCLATGRPSLHRTPADGIRAWQEADPERSVVVGAFGVHSLMVIPLRARGITLGVALLGRHRRTEPFEEDDLLLAEEIGARAALAMDNARRYTHERDTALALQRSLLPQRLAAQGAVEVAYRYLPARTRAGLGGDWFDVIPLSGARVALVVGDVAGHGLRASATMGRLRTVVRTLADVDLPPDELLVHLDDLVTHLMAEEDTTEPQLESAGDLIATCLYLVYDPVSRRCTAAAAGHPPPAVVPPGEPASFVDIAPGPPLGVGGLPFERAEWELPPDSLLALYTDGLVEGTKQDLGRGQEALRQCLTQPPRSLEETCDLLVRSLLPAQPQDDVALLLARNLALDADRVATWDLPSEPAAVGDARAAVLGRLAQWRMDDVAFTAELVVSELVTNAIRYGQPPVQLRLIRDTALICEVSDNSSSAPHMRRARTFDEGGRGLLLVAQFAQRWGTRHHPVGKTIWAEIDLPGGQP